MSLRTSRSRRRKAPRTRFRSTVSGPKRRRPWGTWATPALTILSGRAPVRSRPPTSTRPAVGRTRPEIVPSKVDFPAPLAPISATSSPSLTRRSTPKSTGPAPNPAVRPRTSSSGASAAFSLSAGIPLSQVSLDDPLVLEALGRIPLRENLAEVQHQRCAADTDDDPHHVLDEDDGDAG